MDLNLANFRWHFLVKFLNFPLSRFRCLEHHFVHDNLPADGRNNTWSDVGSVSGDVSLDFFDKYLQVQLVKHVRQFLLTKKHNDQNGRKKLISPAANPLFPETLSLPWKAIVAGRWQSIALAVRRCEAAWAQEIGQVNCGRQRFHVFQMKEWTDTKQPWQNWMDAHYCSYNIVKLRIKAHLLTRLAAD